MHRDKEERNIMYIIRRRRQTGLVAPSVETDVWKIYGRENIIEGWTRKMTQVFTEWPQGKERLLVIWIESIISSFR